MTAHTKIACDERPLTRRADRRLFELPNPKLQEAWEAARKKALAARMGRLDSSYLIEGRSPR